MSRACLWSWFGLLALAGCAAAPDGPIEGAAGNVAPVSIPTATQDGGPPAAIDGVTRAGLPAVARWDAGDQVPAALAERPLNLRGKQVFIDYGIDSYVGPEKPPLTCARMLSIVAAIRAKLSASPTFDAGLPGAGNGPTARRRLIVVLDDLAAKLAAMDGAAPLRSAMKPEGVHAADYEPQGDGDDFLVGDQRITVLAEDGGRFYGFLSEPQALEFKAVLDAVDRLLTTQKAVAEAAERLAANDRVWSDYLQRGYSQYPWESWLNGELVASSWDEPPGWQLIALHPEPAIVSDVRSSRRVNLDPALLVHAVGMVDYFKGPGGDRWFWGASATAALPVDEADGLGLGVTLHFGSTAQSSPFPHLSLGVLWQDHVDGDDGPALTLGIDLARLLSSPDVDRLRGLAPASAR